MTGNNGISASEELNRMAQYDVVLFTCHGYADKWTPGRIDLYANLYITPNAVQNWSGSLSKNKLIFIACCDAGRKVNGTSVADKFKAKGAKAIVCYTDSLAPAFALDMTTLFFSRFAAVGADSAYQMQQYYNYMYNALNNLWPNHPYSMAALRFIR